MDHQNMIESIYKLTLTDRLVWLYPKDPRAELGNFILRLVPMFEDNTAVGGYIEVSHANQVIENYALEDGKLVTLILEEVRSMIDAFEIQAERLLRDIMSYPQPVIEDPPRVDPTPVLPIKVECYNTPVEPEPIIYKWDFILLQGYNEFLSIRTYGKELEYDSNFIRMHNVTFTKTGDTYIMEGEEEQWVAGEYYKGLIDDIEPEYTIIKKRWFGREPKRKGAYRARLKTRLPIKRTYHNIAISILEKV